MVDDNVRGDSSERSPKPLDGAMRERRTDQPRRKRASKACLACRRRKVRCDVAQRGPPCMNCFLDKEDCVVKPRSTKYKVNKRDSEAPQQHRSPTNTGSDQSPPHTHGSPPAHGSSSMQDILMGDSGLEARRDPEYHDHSIVGHERRMSMVGETRSSTADRSNDFGGQRTANAFGNMPKGMVPESQRIADSHVMFSYYSFLKVGSMAKVAVQDVNFLEAQGCFRVPTRPMLDEFVREYFLHVHPMLPILNEKAFWKIYDEHDSNFDGISRISLFVFHTMLFTSCSFLSTTTIHKLGFTDSRSAWFSYYRRAKLLFEFDTESDPLAMAQGTLLMSFFTQTRVHSKANTYWLGIAIHLAKQAEAHIYQTKPGVTHEQRNTLKRLWWCCILRDRILPLGIRKPIQITALNFDTHAQRPLVLEDFDNEMDGSKVYNMKTKRALLQRLVALSELAVTLTETLLTLYPETEGVGHVSQKDSSSAVRACKFELNTWFEKTTVKCLTSPYLGETHESVLLYSNLMWIYYHSAILALCNREVLLATIGFTPGGPASNGLAQIYNTRRQIEEAINGISENLKELVQLKLANYMPISMLAYLALPLVIHLLDVKLSKTPFTTAKKQRRLNIYTEALKALQSQYDVTDAMSDIVRNIMERFSLEQRDTEVETPSNHSEAELGSLTSKSSDDPSIISSWGDVLLRQPKLFLRLTITMDLAMSKTEFPKDLDFPLALQSKPSMTARSSSYNLPSDSTQNSGDIHNGISSARLSSRGIYDASGDIARPSITVPDRNSEFKSNEMILPAGLDSMDFDPARFELPLGFEAFDMELSSKRGFEFDYPWSGGHNTPFNEPI